MKCFRNESSSPSPSPSLELIATCVLQEQQQSAYPLVQVAIKNILESCVSEIDILRHQRPTPKHQQTARGGSFLCFKTFSKYIEPVEEEGEQLWSLLLRLVNIQGLFPLNPLYRTMPEEPC